MNQDQPETKSFSSPLSSQIAEVQAERGEGKRPWRWRLCCLGVVLLSSASFSPLAIPAGRFEPMVAGLPLTLWAGLLIAFAIVILTLIGVRVHPRSEKGRGEP